MLHVLISQGLQVNIDTSTPWVLPIERRRYEVSKVARLGDLRITHQGAGMILNCLPYLLYRYQKDSRRVGNDIRQSRYELLILHRCKGFGVVYLRE
jgi:hypothetical protein